MSGPPQPTPRLPDGTVNLGRVPGEKGVWNVPYITNMGERVVEDDGKTYVEKHPPTFGRRSEEHTSELQSPCNLVCRLLLEKKNTTPTNSTILDVPVGSRFAFAMSSVNISVRHMVRRSL